MQLRAWGGRQATVSMHQAVDHRGCERPLPHRHAAASATDGRPQGSRVGREEAAGREAAARPLQRLAAMLPAAAAAAALLAAPLPSSAVLNSPNAVVARTPEAALRRSIPAFNPAVKQLQTRLEDVTYLLRIPQRKPWASMATNVRLGLDQLEDRNAVLYGVPEANLQRGEELLLSLEESLGRLDLAIGGRDPDKTSLRAAEALAKVAELELLQAPGLEFSVPREYRQLPQLRGRATVELVFEKADGSYAFVDNDVGGVMKQGLVELTLDGYSAPITAGNFASKVLRGTYDGISLTANYDAVTPLPRQKDGGALPLEIRVLGDFEPVYRVPIDVQAGELPVLPLSIDGAVAMLHGGAEQGMESGEDFFIYRFHRQQSGLSALAFDEGTFSVFGYVTKGLTSVVPHLQKGDTLVQARLTSGQDKLVNVQPAGSPS